MRMLLRASVLLAGLASVASAQEHGAAEGGASSLLSPSTGLMFWTLVIFVVLLVVLSKYAFGPLTAAVEAREKALEAAIASAKRDREEAAQLLAEHRAQLEGARADAQRFIAEGRATAEKMKHDLLEQARAQQQEMIERARRDIDAERERAIADLRREAVDLALAGASKIIERNLDEAGNRQLVESFLASLNAPGGAAPRR